jgi:hypothetical protein
MRGLPIPLAGLFLCGCVALTPEDQAYLDRANAFPLQFRLPHEQAEFAWGRAQSFIARFGDLKIQTATGYVIQTFTSTPQNMGYGYLISRTPIGDDDAYTVSCVTANMFLQDVAEKNAHVLAYYIATGDEPTPRAISSF